MALRLLKPTSAGQLPTLDRYHLIAELAAGGMATVLVARRAGPAGFERMVAVKRMHPYLSEDRAFVDMFFDEGRLAGRLHHKNIVPVHEVGHGDGVYYLVMEYIDGVTLGALQKQAAAVGTPVPLAISLRILLDAFEGLCAAQEMKDEFGRPMDVIHRDVSPPNILVGTSGVTKLADFGVAKATTRRAPTPSGHLEGKLAYMAPEQARDEPVDQSADVFAAGTVLWEAVTGKRLFAADSDVATLSKLAFAPIPKATDENPDVPQSVQDVLDRALERDREQRMGTARELRDALRKAAEDAGLVASAEEVSAFVEKVCGDEIAERRRAIEDHLQAVSEGKIVGVAQSRGRSRNAGPGSRTPTDEKAPSAASGRRGAPVWLLAMVATMLVLSAGVAVYLALGAPTP